MSVGCSALHSQIIRTNGQWIWRSFASFRVEGQQPLLEPFVMQNSSPYPPQVWIEVGCFLCTTSIGPRCILQPEFQVYRIEVGMCFTSSMGFLTPFGHVDNKTFNLSFDSLVFVPFFIPTESLLNRLHKITVDGHSKEYRNVLARKCAFSHADVATTLAYISSANIRF